MKWRKELGLILSYIDGADFIPRIRELAEKEEQRQRLINQQVGTTASATVGGGEKRKDKKQEHLDLLDKV
jgi:hypothetical protein